MCGGGIGRRAGAENRGGCISRIQLCEVQILARTIEPGIYLWVESVCKQIYHKAGFF